MSATRPVKKKSKHSRLVERVLHHRKDHSFNARKMCESKSTIGKDLSEQSDRTSVHLSTIRKMLSEEAILKKYSVGMPRDLKELRQWYIDALYFLLDVVEELGYDHPLSPDLLRSASTFELILHPFDYAASNEDFRKDIQSVLSSVSAMDRFHPLRWEKHRK